MEPALKSVSSPANEHRPRQPGGFQGTRDTSVLLHIRSDEYEDRVFIDKLSIKTQFLIAAL